MSLISHVERFKGPLITVGSVIVAYSIGKGIVKLYLRHKRNQKRKAYPKNVVIVHQFPAFDKTKPSMSVPCLKLETWLRITEIKYENDYSFFDRSSQGQLPFVTLNNQDYHDSQFIIENLSKIYGKDLSDRLTQVEKAISRGFLKLLEESFKWTMYYHRFAQGKASDIGFPFLLFKFFRSKIIKAVTIQGYGRHSTEEIYKIGKEDLTALENFLGNKKFLFGDNPCSEDALLFAFVSQLVYYDRGPFNQYLKESCPGLLAHFNMIKNAYWPEFKEVQ